MSRKEETNKALYGSGILGESLAPKKSSELARKFEAVPCSVLSAREGFWQNRKKAWLSLGIRSELGRGENLLQYSEAQLRQVREGKAYPKGYNVAAPGGAAMPAMDYKNRERGTGAGKAIAGSGPAKPKLRGGMPPIIMASSLPPAAPAAEVSSEEEEPGPPGLPMPDFSSPVPPAPPAGGLIAPAKKLRAPPIIMGGSEPEKKAKPRAPAASILSGSFSMPESNWRAPEELPSLAGCKRISFDVETRDEEVAILGCGARREGCFIAGIALGLDDGRRYYFPLRHEGGGNMDPARLLGWAREEFNSFKGEVVGAHLQYDLDFAANEGITFAQASALHDIQVVESLLDEWRLKYSLESLALDYLGEGKRESLLAAAAAAHGWLKPGDIKANLWRLPASYVGPYAEGDVDLPLRIFEKQQPKLASEGLEAIYEVERKLLPVLLAMRRRGVRVDLARAEQVRAGLVTERDKWLGQLRRHAGAKAELMAPDSFIGALKAAGLRPPLTAKTKKPSVTAAWLETHSKSPICRAIIEGRAVNTLLNTFIDGHILGNQIGGRIHTTFNQSKSDDSGTITGRLSSESPNLQNIPKRKELALLIRGLFLPEEGEDLESQDMSQMEYRYLTHYAVGRGAEEARRQYNDDPNTDFHKMCESFIGRKDMSRERVKGVNFCSVYGGGPGKLAQVIGCSFDEAVAFRSLYDAKLPFVRETSDASMAEAERMGHITTILGRRQRFPFWEPRGRSQQRPTPLPFERAREAYGGNLQRARLYTALNKRLQGSNADHSKLALVKYMDEGLDTTLGAPLISVHDELVISVPRTKEGKEAAARACRITETCINLKVPVLVNCKRGPDWGQLK